jgi:hypothetical protein
MNWTKLFQMKNVAFKTSLFSSNIIYLILLLVICSGIFVNSFCQSVEKLDKFKIGSNENEFVRMNALDLPPIKES